MRCFCISTSAASALTLVSLFCSVRSRSSSTRARALSSSAMRAVWRTISAVCRSSSACGDGRTSGRSGANSEAFDGARWRRYIGGLTSGSSDIRTLRRSASIISMTSMRARVDENSARIWWKLVEKASHPHPDVKKKCLKIQQKKRNLTAYE